jgi:hypothetical protein
VLRRLPRQAAHGTALAGAVEAIETTFVGGPKKT